MTSPLEKHVLLVSAAIILHQAGEDERAIEILQEAIRQKADYTPAYVMLGASYQASGQMRLAEEAFRKATEIDPNNTEALQGLGLFLVSQERYPEALPYLEKQFKKNPSDMISLDGLIDALNHLPGREKEVEAALRNAWEKSKNADLGIRYGRYLLDHENNPLAARTVFAAVVEVSKTARTLSELAFTCYITDDCNCAIELLHEAVQIDPQFDRAWRGLSQCYNAAKDYAHALETAERAIAINPNHYRNWQAKSDVLLSLHKFDQVLETSQRGIDVIQSLEEKEEAKPVWAVLRLQRIYAFLELNRLVDALQEIAFAQREISDDIRFYVRPAQVLLSRNQPEQALEILDSASDPIVKEELAPLRYKVLHQLGRGDEAWDYIRSYLENNTEKRLNVLTNIGIEFYQRGFVEPAVAVYRQLLGFKPADARIATNLGYFLIGQGQFAEAETILTTVTSDAQTGEFIEIARCNLAYIYSLTGKNTKAVQMADDVLKSAFASEEVILRIPFWVNGKMLPDPAPIPGREISLANAARACKASAFMALKKLDKSEQVIREMDEGEMLLRNIISGCLERARNNSLQAAQYWKSALELSDSDEERAVIENWLQGVLGD